MTIREYCAFHVKGEDPLWKGIQLASKLKVHIDDLVCVTLLKRELG
ncbi:hypothetical protein [Vibrio agarivorans]|nr:hypothetical protein [Vibrio agarivorans]MDN3659950.1 hypothetical protein [Vibrio agarivorans]